MLSINTSQLEKHLRIRNYAYAEQLPIVGDRQNQLISADFIGLIDVLGYDNASKIFFDTYNRTIPVEAALATKSRQIVKICWSRPLQYRCCH
jgi:hypothetical protein